MIIGRCTFDGCTVLTIGSRCVEHDFPVTRRFARGRPFQHNTPALVLAIDRNRVAPPTRARRGVGR